jgi:16S rRNA (cytidine1402-2'-O)-methyltransferase
MSSNCPSLWVVATPIGNLGDLSERARSVLAEADVVLAEDTRRVGMLFNRLGMAGQRFLSLFEHNEESRIRTVLDLLSSGSEVALVSSAGSPLIADPGYRLVRACRAAGYHVRPVPGPSAPVAALMASGLPPSPFTFLGFLPRKAGDKERTLAPFASIRTTLVFFERKSRLVGTLKLAYSTLGCREVCLARELTKRHEEFSFLRLGQWELLPKEPKGEYTVIVASAEEDAITPQERVVELLRRAAGEGMEPGRIMREVGAAVTGWRRKEIYRLYLRLQRESRNGGIQ